MRNPCFSLLTTSASVTVIAAGMFLFIAALSTVCTASLCSGEPCGTPSDHDKIVRPDEHHADAGHRENLLDVLHAFDRFNLQEQQQLAVGIRRPDIGAQRVLRPATIPRTTPPACCRCRAGRPGSGYFEPFICG